MTVKLTEAATLTIAHDDVAAILTENFAGTYTPFAGMLVALVETDDSGAFHLTFAHPSGDEQP